MNRYSVRFDLLGRVALFFIIAINIFLFTRNKIVDKVNLTDWKLYLAVLLVVHIVYIALRVACFKYYVVVKSESVVIRNFYWTRILDLAQIQEVIIEEKFEEIRSIKLKYAKGIFKLRMNHVSQDEWKRFVTFLSASGIGLRNV